MRVKDVTPAEIELLRDAMDNREFDDLRHNELTHLGGYRLYFDENDNWNKRFSMVPTELMGIILGYRFAKRFRGAR